MSRALPQRCVVLSSPMGNALPLRLGPSPLGLKIEAYIAHALKLRRNILWFAVDKADLRAHTRAFALTT